MNRTILLFSLCCSLFSFRGTLGQPIITLQPSPFTNSVSLGVSLTNKVAATSAVGAVTYQWRLDGVDLLARTNATFILTNIQSSDHGAYTVLLSDASGSVESKSWTVSVDATFRKIFNEPAVNFSGVGTVWGDFDNDGFPDLFIGTVAGTPAQFGANTLLRNVNGGGFAVVSTSNFPAGNGVLDAGWADFDNDGWLDLVAGRIGNDLHYRNNGDGSFTSMTNSLTSSGGGTVGVALADYDNDGYVDAFLVNEGSPNLLFHNDGHGGFTKVMGTILTTNSLASQGAAWGDYDNDGLPDLFVCNYKNNRNFLYHNEGGGRFKEVVTGAIVTERGQFSFPAWGDYNNDGFLDLFVCSYDGPKNLLFRNNGDGTFTKITTGVVATDPGHGATAAWGDYDNDGFLDLFVANGAYQNPGVTQDYLYHNNGDGTFSRTTMGSITNDRDDGRTCAWVDVQRDGFLDLWVSNTSGAKNCLYLNQGNSNHWLAVRCSGRVSNRAGLAAKVRIKTTIHGQETWQLREISGRDLAAHFGLGDAASTAVLRVEWPSGIVQEIHDVPSNQMMVMTEPALLASPALVNGSLQFSLRSWTGGRYVLQSTTDWLKWSDFMRVTNLSGVFRIDAGLPANPKMFYRLTEY